MADTPSREGESKDEKSDLQIFCLSETHSSYNKPPLQSEATGNCIKMAECSRLVLQILFQTACEISSEPVTQLAQLIDVPCVVALCVNRGL